MKLKESSCLMNGICLWNNFCFTYSDSKTFISFNNLISPEEGLNTGRNDTTITSFNKIFSRVET
jgi:hypothetical protein